MPMIITNSKD